MILWIAQIRTPQKVNVMADCERAHCIDQIIDIVSGKPQVFSLSQQNLLVFKD